MDAVMREKLYKLLNKTEKEVQAIRKQCLFMESICDDLRQTSKSIDANIDEITDIIEMCGDDDGKD